MRRPKKLYVNIEGSEYHAPYTADNTYWQYSAPRIDRQYQPEEGEYTSEDVFAQLWAAKMMAHTAAWEYRRWLYKDAPEIPFDLETDDAQDR